MTRSEYLTRKAKTIAYFETAGIVLTDQEKEKVEVADFGKNDPDIGLQLLTYVNTDRVCAKEMVLFPSQTCPEHKHVPTAGKDGKEETFRCRAGKVFLYVEGTGSADAIQGTIPKSNVTVFHEIVLHPGEQYTIYPETLHWFQGGPEGAIVSEFSTRSTDETDVFSDPEVVRETKIEG